MAPSVSEQTTSDKDKHRSAGKKFMDWFKKKPQSTLNKTNHPPHVNPASFNHSSSSRVNDPKLRTHHGAVDQEALTSRPPTQVFMEVKQTLKSMGLEFKRDGGEYKLKCVRPKRVQPQHQPNANLRMLLRRSSNTLQPERTTPAFTEKSTIYGEPSVDPGLYIVDMRRMRGNVWAYKYLYRTLMDALKLKQDDYLNRPHTIAESTVEEEEEEAEESDPNNNNVNNNNTNNRMSTASSGGSIGALITNNDNKKTDTAV